MRHLKLALASTTLIGAGMLLYGAVVEANRVVVERKKLRLPLWPNRLAGYKIALLADFHIRGPYSLMFCKRAMAAALEEEPDMVVLAGDVVGYWSPEMPALVGELLEPLLLMNGSALAIPGNHEYQFGTPEHLATICNELNIKFLQNQSWVHDGITWVGVDTATWGKSDPIAAMKGVQSPAVCVWHEPDLVELLPEGCSLMLSGHSHGGQFRFPGGFTPMYTNLGRKYPRGFYADAPTPLYVSRGIGTTGPPSRFNCAPEVSILSLYPGDEI